MTVTEKRGAFTAERRGNLLSVSQHNSRLFTLPLTPLPWFVMHSDGLYAQNDRDGLTPLYRGSDAGVLLDCISSLLERRAAMRQRVIYTALAGAVLLATFALGGLTFRAGTGSQTGQNQGQISFPNSTPDDIPAAMSGLARGQTVLPPDRVLSPVVQTPVVSPAAHLAQNADGWSVSPAFRAELPQRLKKAASRGLFTVPLSTGHARTLYVFSDPGCPECQKMEKRFESVSGDVNVVFFPVTVIGGVSSLHAAAQVLALPETERAMAWKTLFSADAGMSVPGQKDATPVHDAEAKAELARGAVGVNDVAYREYRIPGTPWTVSDDGRYVPQAALASPQALNAFLSKGK